MAEQPLTGNRFANTFLSYANLERAVPDEVLIDKTNGKLYYKRADGTIVDILKDNGAIISDDLREKIENAGNANIQFGVTQPSDQKVGGIWFERVGSTEEPVTGNTTNTTP